jgi:16S rRNA (cytidine1402-2'-O)-methyltransferase
MAEAREPDEEALATAIGGEIARQLTRPLAPGLYLVATPIGQLADITLRALAVLARADLLYCEDTRHSRTLLAHYAIARPLRPYHDHNAARERPAILAALAAGKSVALVSDAGTPLLADPGFKLARAAIGAGVPVVPVPGPSALLAALCAAGLPTDTFLFAGFLPPRSGERRARIAALADVPATLVVFETAPRLAESLADLAAGLGARDAAIARELTKRHESVVRAPLAALAAEARDRGEVRGEIVLVIAPPAAGPVADSEILERLRPRLAAAGPSAAAREVALALGIPRARVYALALGLKQERDENQ